MPEQLRPDEFGWAWVCARITCAGGQACTRRCPAGGGGAPRNSPLAAAALRQERRLP